MTCPFYSFIHNYLAYRSIALRTTFMSKLKRQATKQRQAVKVIPFQLPQKP